MPLIAKDSHVLLSHVSRERESIKYSDFLQRRKLWMYHHLWTGGMRESQKYIIPLDYMYTIHTSMIFIAAEKAQGLDGLFQTAHFLVFYAVLLLFCPQLMNVMSRFFYFHFLFFLLVVMRITFLRVVMNFVMSYCGELVRMYYAL